ncbi:MAG: carotenoid 1,2-hydratase [Pseudomonadota bacterium]
MQFLPSPLRRSLLLAGLSAAVPASALPPQVLRFPRDYGSHPDFRTEWWYVTGHAKSGNREFGFQVTFFRSRVDGTQALRSGFAAKQLLFAHAAITDVQGKKLVHDQRIARASGNSALDQGTASETDTAITLRDWSLKRTPQGYVADITAGEFALQLNFTETQPVLLQGRGGLSRKGPEPEQASYYYSLPQLTTRGSLTLRGQRFAIDGKAWLDHEWSEALLHPRAVGWDWIGMNLFDGSAVTAFRLRDGDGNALWDGGSFRHPKAGLFIASKGETAFQPLKTWKSPLTQAVYPIEWLVRTTSDFYTVKAVVPAQELDSRQSTGAIYWEGLSDLFDGNQRHVGRGYLEMTGYAKPLQL